MDLKVNIPESLDDIKLSSFQKFVLIENPSDLDVLECFFGIKSGLEMKRKDVKYLVNSVLKLLDNPSQDLIINFKLNNTKFGFIPSLDNCTYGEHTNIIEYINKPEHWNKAMAVLYRPVIQEQFGKYLIEKYEGSDKYSQLMLDAPLSVFLSAQVFFWNLTKDFMSCIPAYIRQESQHLTAENGETIQRYTDSLEVDLINLKKHLKSHCINV